VTAVVTTITDGKFASESETTSEIKGRIEPMIARVKKPDGEYTDISGKFFTKADKVTDAKKLSVNGVTYSIIYWWEYQTYSEIWLD
jgi:hypothetical protein